MADQLRRPVFEFAAPPLVDRERERANLRDALAAALAGRGRLVLIGGEAGLSKPALDKVLLAEAAGQGALGLVGRCYDLTETPLSWFPSPSTRRAGRPCRDRAGYRPRMAKGATTMARPLIEATHDGRDDCPNTYHNTRRNMTLRSAKGLVARGFPLFEHLELLSGVVWPLSRSSSKSWQSGPLVPGPNRGRQKQTAHPEITGHRFIYSRANRALTRSLPIQRRVRIVLWAAVEVRRVLPQDAPQVRLAQDEDVIQALVPHTSEEVLADGVLPGGAVGGARDGDAARLGYPREGRPVLAIVVYEGYLVSPCRTLPSGVTRLRATA